MSTPRIIAGKARGMRLKDVPGDSTRPITDRVKESLFSILSSDLEDSTWLDVFGGTGSVGIEALSRGASYARFIDINRQAVETIQSNLAHTGLSSQAKVIRSDAFTLISQNPDRSFEYIYIAPPQYKGLWLRCMREFDRNPGWLAQDGWIIVQIDPLEYEAVDYEHFYLIDQRKYGNTLLLFFAFKQDS